jgi:hypothetical protein
MLIIFFDIKEIVHKEFVLVDRTANPAYYYGDRENVRRLRPELWRQKNWVLYHHNTPSHTSFLPWIFLTKNNMTIIPHPPCLLFSVSPIEDKAERPPF